MDIRVKTQIVAGASAAKIFQTILSARGYRTKSAQKLFLNPPKPTLAYLLKESGLKKTALSAAKKILDYHLAANHDICVFGDYDADGVTATALLWQALIAYAKSSGSTSRILPFIPDRHHHGYGLSELAVAEVSSGTAFVETQFSDFIPQLVLTVDTGIVAHSGIQEFRTRQIDVIVTDHHQPEKLTPAANCILHSVATSGAGLAWIFSLYLLGIPAQGLLDLATIGVVADMMPLTGMNRALAFHGLSVLSQTTRPGLLSMKAAMGVGDKSLTTYDISFGIAPRINASGRIYNPQDALRLLCTTNRNQAQELAVKIEAHNSDRQAYTDRALKLAAGKTVMHKIIVVSGDYHEGVIGLVAGKLTELFHRPAVVMSNQGKVVKGSARSIPGVNVTTLLRSLKTPFLGLGGHDQAAGFSLASKDLMSLTRELETLADQTIKDALLTKKLVVDLALSPHQVTLKLAQLLSTLEPFGIGNPKPKFLLSNLTVLEDRELGKTGAHHKLALQSGESSLDLLLFNTKESHPLKTISALIATIDINTWNGRDRVQLIGSHVEI